MNDRLAALGAADPSARITTKPKRKTEYSLEQLAAQAQSLGKQIEDHASEIKAAAAKIPSASDAEYKKLSDAANSALEQARNAADKGRQAMETLKRVCASEELCGQPAAVRSNVFNSASTKFKESIQGLFKAQGDLDSARTTRHHANVRLLVSGATAEDVAAMDSDQGLQQVLEKCPDHATKNKIRELQSKQQDLKHLVAEVKELTELSRYFDTLVLKQGEILDRVETNMEETYDNVDQAGEEITEAKVLKESYDRKKFWMYLAIFVGVVLTGVYIYFQWVPKSQEVTVKLEDLVTTAAPGTDVRGADVSADEYSNQKNSEENYGSASGSFLDVSEKSLRGRKSTLHTHMNVHKVD